MIGNMIKCFMKAMAQAYVSEYETPATTKWGTIINPLPKGAVLLEETSDVLQWKRRYQVLVDGRIIEYTETDDCLGYTKKSRIVKE